MPKIYDISMSIYEGMAVYKNKPEKQPQYQTIKNNYVSESRLSLDVHTGTHVDAPLHMIEQGQTIEALPIERLVGPCRVVDLMQVVDGIMKDDLTKLGIKQDEFILFKTTNSLEDTFNPEFIFVKEHAANYLAELRIRGVGIDSLGIERSQPGHPTHKALFNAGIIVIEGLRLNDVPAGDYFMVAAPLKLQGVDASPARVLLLEGLS